VFVWPPAPSGCCGDCAATGDAKSSAVINASFFICSTRFSLVHHRPGDACCRCRPHRRHGPSARTEGFWTSRPRGGGRTLAANAKVHRGSIVPRLRAGDVSGDARNCCAMEKETRTTQAQAHWPAALEPCDKRSRARPSYRLTQWRARPDAPDPTDELRRNIRPPPSPARLTQ
jgi:hypothetical protein